MIILAGLIVVGILIWFFKYVRTSNNEINELWEDRGGRK